MTNNTALITGASSGIGYEMAKEFARHGCHLVLAARNREKLQMLAKELEQSYHISVFVIEIDLTLPEAAQRMYQAVKEQNIIVDVLVNNAGAGKVGLFTDINKEADESMIQLNITALTQLTKLFAADMIKQKAGRILNVASTGSFHPGPYTAVYYATKAYVLSFSEAIANELAPYHISVTALCPGATLTNFAKSAGKADTKGAMTAEQVAKTAYKGLMQNKKVVVPGVANKFLVKLPRKLVCGMVGKYQKKMMEAAAPK